MHFSMPTYSYVAKSFQGEEKRGIMEAKDEYELAHLLREQGYVLISAVLTELKTKTKISSFLSTLLPGISLTEKLMFTRNLKVMVGAGISIPRALGTLSLQAKNKRLRHALEDIKEQVIKGKKFCEALATHSDIFSELYVSMVRVGEESGTLEEVLDNLAFQMEREYEVRSKIKGALMYPAVVITAMIGVGILMLIVVVPQLASTFKELGIDLPLTTRIVIAIGTFMSKFWYTLPLFLLVFIIIGRFIFSFPQGKKGRDWLFLHFPILANIVRQSNSAYITRTLSALIKAGVPMVHSLEIIARSVGNVYFREAIFEASRELKRGGKLSEVFSRYLNLFPPLVPQMMQVGEETGQTAEILSKLAEFFEQEVTNATKNLTAVIEPILMLIIGAVVGFFAVAMIQPMYSMISSL